MRKHILVMFIFFNLSTLAVNVFAECEFKDDGTTYSQACLYKKNYEQTDSKLNATYQKLIQSFNRQSLEKNKELLVAAQRIWIKYRDANCELANNVFGGTNSISYSRCLSEQTKYRLQELEKMLTVYDISE